MPPPDPTCPLTRRQVIDAYFLEHRAKALDIAAFLDRVDRARPGADAADGDGDDDFRLDALRRALRILLEEEPGRAARLLDVLSDHTTEPIASAAGMKGAHGAPPPPPPPRGAR